MKLSSATHRRSRAGFTLTELLAVVAIVGILAGIIVPVVVSVRAKARDAQCQSNQRQIAQALLLYANDHRGALPPLANANTGDSSWWTNRLVDGGYLPGGKWNSREWGSLVSGPAACPLVNTPSWYGGIAYSAAVANYGKAAVLNRIANPGRVSLVADAPIAVNAAGQDSAAPSISNPYGKLWSGDRHVNRHAGGGYVTFVDGHVEHWSEADLMADKNGLFDPVW